MHKTLADGTHPIHLRSSLPSQHTPALPTLRISLCNLAVHSAINTIMWSQWTLQKQFIQDINWNMDSTGWFLIHWYHQMQLKQNFAFIRVPGMLFLLCKMKNALHFSNFLRSQVQPCNGFPSLASESIAPSSSITPVGAQASAHDPPQDYFRSSGLHNFTTCQE